MKIKLASVIVSNQSEALRFYTEVLGFQKKTDIPMGEHRWLTVVSADDPDGTELVLEPNALPAAARFQKELFEAGVPQTSFEVEDIVAEHARLQARGVVFRTAPADAGVVKIAMFEDGCGNLVQMHQTF